MGFRRLESLILLLPCGIITGCYIPVPVLTNDEVYITQHGIEELLANSSSKVDVVNILGDTPRQYESVMSYFACYEPGGVRLIQFYNFGQPFLKEEYEIRKEQQCFELLLLFDESDRLIQYEKIFFDGKYKVPHRETLPIIRSMAEKGFPESQWRLYFEYGQKTEDAIWLCRSADNGYAKAQLEVGHFYRSASNIEQNMLKAYVWYKLAATGDNLQDLIVDDRAQGNAATAMRDVKGVLTPNQLLDAENLYIAWNPGQCESELMPYMSVN